MADTAARGMRAWVLHPDIRTDRLRRDPAPALEEAVALARALPDLTVAGAEVVAVPAPRAGLLFGRGKVDEIGERLRAEGAGLVLVDGPVTPTQQRNLERAWGVKLLDRTGLILEIFAERAASHEGELQVELAALSYQRTRLVRAWTHLERQRGGLGFVGGPGETQIEADRRAIDTAITRLRRRLDKVARTRALHRAGRDKAPAPVVALVGYTNAGKSTLFNRLTGAEVGSEDMLFATLDPTMRGVDLGGGARAILSDTVGFISDLPTQLVAAFRATLEEVVEADLILHVRDIAHPESEAQAGDVADVLAELGVTEATPQIEVWNKIDRLAPAVRAPVESRAERSEDIVPVSARTGEGLDALVAALRGALEEPKRRQTLTLAFSDGRRRAWLHEQGIVEREEAGAEGHSLTVRWSARQEQRFREM